MRRRLVLATVLVVGAGTAGVYFGFTTRNTTTGAVGPLVLDADRTTLPADGVSMARVVVRAPDGRNLAPNDVVIRVGKGGRRARVGAVFAGGGVLHALVHAGIEPGEAVVEVAAGNSPAARLRLDLLLDAADRFGDGTPDFLRLESDADRQAFRRWFTFLAEIPAFLEPRDRPGEINDCAALVRFAYRESLREHSGAWAEELRLPVLPRSPSVEKYAYPFTPLGAGLFRVAPGRFRAQDVSSGVFAQFADARTLRELNTHPVTRELRQAEPGDLLFYRQLEQDLPFHVMVFLGRSQLEPGPDLWVTYHTGPEAEAKGEIRRVRLRDLLAHPSPRWRPVAGNPNFLGVYRWNILRQVE